MTLSLGHRGRRAGECRQSIAAGWQAGWPPTLFSSKILSLVALLQGSGRDGNVRGTAQLLGCSFAKATLCAVKHRLCRHSRCWGQRALQAVFSRAQQLCGAALAQWESPGELILYSQAPLAECPGVGEPGRAAKRVG